MRRINKESKIADKVKVFYEDKDGNEVEGFIPSFKGDYIASFKEAYTKENNKFFIFVKGSNKLVAVNPDKVYIKEAKKKQKEQDDSEDEESEDDKMDEEKDSSDEEEKDKDSDSKDKKDEPKEDEKKTDEKDSDKKDDKESDSEDKKKEEKKKPVKEAKRDDNFRKKALVDFLGLDASEVADVVDYSEYTFETSKGVYLVLTDDEADVRFKQYEETIWNEKGLDAFDATSQEWILENAVFIDDSNKMFFIEQEAIDIIENSEKYSSYFEKYKDTMIIDLSKERDLEDYLVSSMPSEETFNLEGYLKGLEINDIVGYYQTYSDLTNIAYEIMTSIINDEYKGDIFKYIDDKNWYDSKKDILDNMLIFTIDVDAIIGKIKEEDGRGPSLASDDVENKYDYEGETIYIYKQN